jgi:hypothetical protein
VGKSVSVLLVAAVCVVLFGLPAAANAEDMNIAKRWAVGLSASPFSGYAPTVEYWTSDNFGLSANFSWYYWWSTITVRGTYLFDDRINIFSMPARPYAGAGVGFTSWYGGHSAPGLEVFGGLLQPFSQQFSVRAELNAASYGLFYKDPGHGWFPIGVGFGVFYHFGG